MDAEVIAALVTAIPATLIAVAGYFISRNQNKLETKRAQRELFIKYNDWFDRMNEYLNAIRDNTFVPAADRTQKQIIQDYLNLYSEEYLWYKNGLIGEEVWNVWLDGVQGYLKVAAIAEIFAYERRTAPNSYHGIFQVLPLG